MPDGPLTAEVIALKTEVGRLATAVEVSNERWTQQGTHNLYVMEKIESHGRTLFGGNGNVGVVGQTALQDAQIEDLEEAEALHADRVKRAFWLVVGSAFAVMTALVSSGVIFYLGWK